jgi:hypothetical protein
LHFLQILPQPRQRNNTVEVTCPKYQGKMHIIAFLSDYTVVDRIINHLKLTFAAERPPPPQMVSQELFMAAESSAEYFS